jgi:DNA-binding transcriptional LysR family regulator
VIEAASIIDLAVQPGRAQVSVQVSGNLRANNGDALRAAAIAGQGLIYQPTFIVADDLRAGALVTLDLDQPTVEFGGIYAVYLPDRHPPAKVRAFIDFIATRFAPDPPGIAASPLRFRRAYRRLYDCLPSRSSI